MDIVDAQIHLWQAEAPDRPWPPGRAHEAQKPYPITIGTPRTSPLPPDRLS